MKNLIGSFFGRTQVSFPAANEIFIWPQRNDKPEKFRTFHGERILSGIHNPSLTPYFPDAEKTTGVAVIIAPGGGHKELWIDHEGHFLAKWLCENGITAFVLKYRLANEPGSLYSIRKHALADMQRAIRLVRCHSKEWNININSIGVMGFSAGGEIAGLAALHFDDGNKNSTEEIELQSSYPNFQALIYPAGANQFKPSKNSPPVFLLSGQNDTEISRAVSALYGEYKNAGIQSDLRIFPDTGHGFGFRKNNKPAIANWPELFLSWLSATGFYNTDDKKIP